MGLFGKPKAGGLMDEIRCDESNYLIWKWHPNGSQKGNNNRENAIRWGSALRVKDGEVAVFVYKQIDGTIQELIEGPYDDILETGNLPVIANIVSLAYEGGTPFPAEVYFINMAGIVQVPFGVPYFDLFDPRFPDYGVPTAVRGTITFNIRYCQEFIKLHRLVDFDVQAFQTQIRDAVIRYVKDIVSDIPSEKNIPVVQIERYIGKINNTIEEKIRDRFENDFGVNILAVDISAIEIDKSSDQYQQLKAITVDLTAQNMQAQTRVNIKNMEDMQRINAEETQYAQRKQTQMNNFAAFQLEQQTVVGVAGAEALGQMGNNGGANIDSGMNPVGLMTGMAMGGVIGKNMVEMVDNMMDGVNEHSADRKSSPPPIPNVISYHVVINGIDDGAKDINLLKQMVSENIITKDSLVWKDGMADWVKAGDVIDLQPLFANSPPPIPPNA